MTLHFFLSSLTYWTGLDQSRLFDPSAVQPGQVTALSALIAADTDQSLDLSKTSSHFRIDLSKQVRRLLINNQVYSKKSEATGIYRKVVYKSRCLCAIFKHWGVASIQVRLLIECSLYASSESAKPVKAVRQR